MAGKAHTFSKGQQEEVVRIFCKKLLKWILLCFAILAGVTGLSLWRIMERVESEMENLVAKQFEEPRIQEVVRKVAAERAFVLMTEQVSPEVTKFKAEIADELKELHSLVATTRELESKSRKHEQSIRAVLTGLQISLKQGQDANKRLASIRSDLVEMQKCIARMQYYRMKGSNILPFPYQKETLAALNKLIAIAIPDPAERSKFVADLQGPPQPKKE